MLYVTLVNRRKSGTEELHIPSDKFFEYMSSHDIDVDTEGGFVLMSRVSKSLRDLAKKVKGKVSSELVYFVWRPYGEEQTLE